MNNKYITARELAEVVDGVVWGDSEKKIYKIALPKDSDERALTYFESYVSSKRVIDTKFAVCIVPMTFRNCDNRTYIVVNKGIYRILHLIIKFLIEKGLYILKNPKNFVGNNTYISESAQIGQQCYIGNNVVIEDNVIIGNNCIIGSNVVIEHDVFIGNQVHIQSGAVIGSDSFEFAEVDKYCKVDNLGTVVIMDQVIIGANTTIARGTIGNTFIDSGTVIDTLVQIGHEVIVGKNCKICSQCGIAGWAKLEDNVVLYGKVGISNNIVIGKNAIVLAMSGISKNIKENSVVSGIPALDNRDYLKEKAILRKIAKKGELS